MIAILDSSAMLALLLGEPEGEVVRGVFQSAAGDEEDAQIYAHSVNLAEVFYFILNSRDEATAEASIALLKAAGLQERADIDAEFWRQIARLIHQARQRPSDAAATSKRSNLALGDAFGVCLANRMGGDFVTKDRAEIGPLNDAGLVSALFIR